jgi:hypothetical protein
MRRIPNLAEAGANRIVKEVAQEMLRDLILITPVDTSKALSNWQASQSFPILDDIDPYFPGNFGSTRGPSSSAAIRVGASNVRRKLKGTVLYISNNADYITKLNRGSSRQAPAGFVEGAVMRASRSVRSKRLFRGSP